MDRKFHIEQKPTLEEMLRKPDFEMNLLVNELAEQRKRSDEFLAERLKELEAKGVFVI